VKAVDYLSLLKHGAHVLVSTAIAFSNTAAKQQRQFCFVQCYASSSVK